MAGLRPDWQRLMADAPELTLDGADGPVYLVADSHLGDARAPVDGFLAMLEQLGDARLLVLLGDLFKVWLALPKFWDAHARRLMEALHGLRAGGVPVWLVVGNREFFLPASGAEALRRGLPFDAVIRDAAVLAWGGRRYGLTHGDLVNRDDAQYLRWRRIARSRGLEALFRAIPGPIARRIAERLERGMAGTNREIKIRYPHAEVQAFAEAVVPGLDGVFIGHFHRDETIVPTGGGGGAGAALRIVPDWHARKQVLRLHADGRSELVGFPQAEPAR